MVSIERLKVGVKGFDSLIAGGVPRGFFVAVTGEPGTGKTVFSLHFAWQGVLEGDKVIYVTTEESRESIIRQAQMFKMDFTKAVGDGKMIIIDALMRGKSDEWSIEELEVEALVEKVIEAKRKLGYGRARLVIDSMSAFWLDKPAMARKYSYMVKRLLYRWDFTTLLVSQYAITTSEAFGFGVEHVADGIIRFRKSVKGGVLRRFLLVEKMRQTPHDTRMYEVDIVDGVGMIIKGPAGITKEDVALPEKVKEEIKKAKKKAEEETP
ncbi:MAG: KaiC domain-containing protein [Thermoprotei archaeon]|nr:KaiC domain-containing protein [Thermoprotei archaeon]